METVTSCVAAEVPADQLRMILAEYAALDHARVFRRLLVTRCGLLTLAAVCVAAFMHGLSLYARWVPVGVFALPPTWAWIAERRLETRLSRRLDGIKKP